MIRSALMLAAASLAFAAAAQEPGAGPDPGLEAISPQVEKVRVGLAGEDPSDIARYLLARGASAPAISPDGSAVAFRSTVTGTPQLWITPSTGGQAKQLTFGNGITFFRWTPDGSELIYGADNDGNEQEAYYAVSADGSRERLLLPAVEGGFRVFGDITADGETVVFASTERNGLDYDIYVGDLSTGQTRRVYEGEFGFFARAISPDGKAAVVAETVGEDSDNLYLLDLADGTLKTLSKPDPRANHTEAGVVFSPDGAAFYFASNAGGEFAQLMRYDMEAGTMTQVAKTDRDVVDLALCGPDGRWLVFEENVDGFSRLHARDLSTGRDVAPPDLPEGLYALSCGEGSAKVGVGVNGWRTPGDVFVWDLESGAASRVYESDYAGIDPGRLVRPESIRMTARDGLEVQGLLYLPDAASRTGEGPPPVVFEVHGGPTGQSVAGFEPVIQYLVDQGIAVFEPNVRGSTGFGRTYVTLDDQEKRRDSVADLIDMLAALRADGRVDADRAAVAGGSYGGYMVNAVLALYPDAFRAGVSRYGVADWVTALQVASPALKASDRIEYGDIREQRWIDYYTENSPIRMADAIRVPVLYSHGVMDPRIDIYETEEMVRTLRANGIETPYIRIPDEGHGWRKLANRLFYYRREADFLKEALAE